MTSFAEKTLRQTARRLVLVQASLVLATAAVYLSSKGWHHAMSAAFGGGIALLNTVISAQRLARSAEFGLSDPKRGMLELYLGAITRFVATPALVAVGIAVLGLDPLAIIIGFAVAQLGYFVTRARPS